MGERAALTAAVLLDVAVSPLFAWDVFATALRRELGAGDGLLAGVFSVGLVFTGWGIAGLFAPSPPPRSPPRSATAGSTEPSSSSRHWGGRASPPTRASAAGNKLSSDARAREAVSSDVRSRETRLFDRL